MDPREAAWVQGGHAPGGAPSPAPRPARHRAARRPRRPPSTGAPPLAARGAPGPRASETPPQGGPTGSTGRTPEAQGRTAGASAQCQLEDLYDPQNPNTALIFYMEGDLEPRPDPDRHTAIFMVTPLGEEILRRVVPRSRWPQGDGYVEQL